MAQYARQTAIPCTLREISEGAWVQNEGLVPSGVRTGRGMIARASIIGVMISKEEKSFAIDDGTNIISVRSFDPVPVHANIGDIVLVIGRPREYNGERYLALEICKRVRNPSWVQYRKRELECVAPADVHVAAPSQVPVAPAPVPVEPVKNPFEAIVQAIRAFDNGPGADIEEVLAAVPEGAKFIQTLIEEGEIFEIRPGRLKVLE
jgi:hypothetical protein